MCANRDTHVIKINVGTTVVGKHEVPNGVGALDGIVVSIEGVQEPWVLGGNELARFFVGPELEIPLAGCKGGLQACAYNIFIVGVQVDTALLRLDPDFGDRFILVGLVNDLGDYLRALFNQAGVRGGELGAVDGVRGGIFD